MAGPPDRSPTPDQLISDYSDNIEYLTERTTFVATSDLAIDGSATPEGQNREISTASLARDGKRIRVVLDERYEFPGGKPAQIHRQAIAVTQQSLYYSDYGSAGTTRPVYQVNLKSESDRMRMAAFGTIGRASVLFGAVPTDDGTSISEILRSSATRHLDFRRSVDGRGSEYILRCGGEHGTYEIVFDADRVLACKGLTVTRSEASLHNGRRLRETRILKESRTFPPLQLVGYTLSVGSIVNRRIEDHYLPERAVVREEFRYEGGRTLVFTAHVSIGNYKTYAAGEAVSDFRLDIPDGTPVVDREGGGLAYIWENGWYRPAANPNEVLQLQKAVDQVRVLPPPPPTSTVDWMDARVLLAGLGAAGLVILWLVRAVRHHPTTML